MRLLRDVDYTDPISGGSIDDGEANEFLKERKRRMDMALMWGFTTPPKTHDGNGFVKPVYTTVPSPEVQEFLETLYKIREDMLRQCAIPAPRMGKVAPLTARELITRHNAQHPECPISLMNDTLAPAQTSPNEKHYEESQESRFCFMKRVKIYRDTGELYIDRLILLRVKWFSIMFHKIYLTDNDCMHDHPWSFVTFLLKGGYVEHTPDGAKLYGAGASCIVRLDGFTVFRYGNQPGPWSLPVLNNGPGDSGLRGDG